LPALYSQLCHVKGTCDVPIVLVGNKCDLENKRGVGRDQGENLAHQWGRYCSFMEVSAKARINITEAFYELVRLIQEKEGKIKKHWIHQMYTFMERAGYLPYGIR